MDSENPSTSRIRKIVHVDMDAFYASVEQRDNPQLRGRPVVVGGERERGVVAAASYEARVFGIRSAMPSTLARRKCPDLVFVKPRFDVYREVSGIVRAIFELYTPVYEPIALDEASLDVTENHKGLELARDVAAAIRADILKETGLTSSAGVSFNKFLAKMASGMRKPNGQFVIPPSTAEAFVAGLEIDKFHGIGPATAARMREMGIANGADLRKFPLDVLVARFGKVGGHYFDLARGVDLRPVQPHRVRKSLGSEETFAVDIDRFLEARQELVPIVGKVSSSCKGRGLSGRTVTLKAKYSDFVQVTRSRSLPRSISNVEDILSVADRLLESLFPLRKPIRLLGVSMSGFDGEVEEVIADPRQLSLSF